MIESLIRPPMIVDLREWFMGCAMANHNIVTATDPEKAALQAAIVAEQMMCVLRQKPPPTEESFPTMSIEQMNRWQSQIAKNERSKRITVREMRKNDE
jgi:hypothetical protein